VAELGTAEQQLIFLNTHWGRLYAFAAPTAPDGEWTATARFSEHRALQAATAADLLNIVRAHHQANRPER
jgi:hypothetical protein